MNRRVLLIDADIAFRDTLTRELGRYKVVVMTEPAADRALQLATADPPALIVLCIEDAEKKAGWRVFEKCKKGALSKVPIVLITGSVPPDAFAKHRGMKVHADDYIDKRTMSTHELVGKIDGLITLGDPQDDDLAIPVEDEIPMEIADGDVVLDEVVEEPSAAVEFDPHHARTVGPHDGLSMDSVMDAETDAAFAAILGDEVVEARAPSVAIAPEHESRDEAAVEGVVPEPIHDGRGRGTTPPPLHDSVPGVILDAPGAPPPAAPPAVAPVSVDALDDAPPADFHSESHVEIHAPVPHEDPVPEPVQAAPADLDPVPEHVPDPNEDYDSPVDDASSRYESQPAIPIDDDDMVSLDEDLAVEVEEPEAAARAPAPAAAGPATLVAAPMVPAAPILPDPLPAPSSQPVRAGSGSHPAIDLGLDKLAQDAESEQSGVYDRRALRKIGELERQIAQLKVELERARAAGDAASKGSSREAQFLNLRESMLAKDKELKQVKGDLVSRDQDLAEAKEKLRQAQHARTTIEAKNNELEQRLLDDSGKSTQLAASARASAAQLAAMQQELDTMAKAHGGAEQARAQLERDLANERATGAASASESERLLRVEREQLIGRHKNEVASLKSEAQTAHDLALAQLREELETSHGVALNEAIEELRRANSTEHQDAVTALERVHASEMVALKADHAGEHSKLRNELGAEVARLEAAVATSQAAHEDAIAAGEREVAAAVAAHREAVATHQDALATAHAEHQQTITQLQAKHEATLAAAHASHRDELAAARAALEATLNEAKASHEDTLAGVAAAHSVALADQSTQHAVALEELRRSIGGELDELRAKHAAELAARDDEHEESRDRELESHGRALGELKSELDRTVASHEVKLGAAKRDHEQAIAELRDEHQATLGATVAAHEAEVGKLRSAHDQLAEAARRTAETHRAALAEAEAKHAAELSQVAESAGREVAEHKGAAAAARRAIEDNATRLEAEREAAAQAHTQALNELAAKHERALALSNGEFLKQKAVGDAEHAKALAAHQAAAEKTRTELTSERDELKRGLSSARDTLKRSEGELASAVQSIADRNAELRSHASAIAERDQRIAELRKEIESVEAENASYQEQVLRAYQKIKADEAMVARARKAMAIALTVLDDEGKPKET